MSMKCSRKRKILRKIPRNPSWLLLLLQLILEMLCLGRSLLLSLLRSGRGPNAKPGPPSSLTQREHFPLPKCSALPLSPPRTSKAFPQPSTPTHLHQHTSLFPSSLNYTFLCQQSGKLRGNSILGEFGLQLWTNPCNPAPALPTQMKERG